MVILSTIVLIMALLFVIMTLFKADHELMPKIAQVISQKRGLDIYEWVPAIYLLLENSEEASWLKILASPQQKTTGYGF